MENSIEKTGKSVEEAISLALEELGCTREEAEIEILSAPAKGFLGILGSKEARVLVRKSAGTESSGNEEKDNDVRESRELPPDPEDKTAKFIVDVTGLMGINASIGKKESEEVILYTLNGPKMGAVIGRRGETLDALQYLSNIVAGKDRDIPRKRIVVDAEDYRKRREDTLVRLATRLATKAKRSGRRVVLEPMNPQERRVIHTTLEKDPDVRSVSEGEEPYRRLVIYPVGGGGGDGRRDGAGRYGRGGGRYDRAGGSGRSDSYTGSASSWDRDDDGDEEDREDGE